MLLFAAWERARAAEGALDGRRGGGRDRRGPPPLRGRCRGDQGGGSEGGSRRHVRARRPDGSGGAALGQRQTEDHHHGAVGDGRQTRAAREAATHRRAVGAARARKTRDEPREALRRRPRIHVRVGQISPSASVDHHRAAPAAAPAAAGVPGQLPGSFRQTQQPARGGHDLRRAVRRRRRRRRRVPRRGARLPADVLLDG